MKKLEVVFCLAAVLAASSAHAGLGINDSVVVVAGGASGSITDASYSPNQTEYIGCNVNVAKNSASSPAIRWIICGAKDAAGKGYSCSYHTPPQALVDVVSGLNDSSWVYFWGNGAGQCLGLLTHRGSPYLP